MERVLYVRSWHDKLGVGDYITSDAPLLVPVIEWFYVPEMTTMYDVDWESVRADSFVYRVERAECPWAWWESRYSFRVLQRMLRPQRIGEQWR